MKDSVRWLRTPPGVLVSAWCFTVVLALGANWAFEFWQVGGERPTQSVHSVSDNVTLFLLGSFVIWLCVIFLVAVLGRLWISTGVVVVATAILAFANHQKEQFRLEPLYPSDLKLLPHLGFLTTMIGVEIMLVILAGTLAVLAGAVVAGRRLNAVFPRPSGGTRSRVGRALVATRVVGALVSVLLLAYSTQFHSPGNLLKAAYDQYGAHWKPLNQSKNYQLNGFVGGMLYNLTVPAMKKPTDYSEPTMQRLVGRYAAVADRINRDRDPAALSDVNVVMVLSESFSDPTRIKRVGLDQDPIPYTRRLMQRTTSGSMLAQSFGGGTANMEFEALTGMSLSQFQPQMHTPYQMLVPDNASFPSAAEYLRQRGLGTLAMHSFTSALYRRAEVYPIFGFEDAVFQDEMSHVDHLAKSNYISDEATFDEVLARLDSSNEPMFVNVATMQNHYPMAGKYHAPIPSTGLRDAEVAANFEHYARGLRHSDKAMKGLIEALEASDEQTVLVFYGDHLPSVWPQKIQRANGERTMHETPFFVYANFGEPVAEQLPTTSPVYFMNHVLERAHAAVPPYYALLEELEKEIPAMEQIMTIGPDNQEMSDAELSPRARRLLRDYRLVQYDLAVGQRYSMDAMFDPTPSDGPAR